jgi:ribosomal protein L37AE/L43A
MIYFKACPRCKGELYSDRDAYGHFRKCLQCGRIFEGGTERPTMQEPETDKVAA